VLILGLSAYYHDSAAALLVDGRIVAAAQEERFTRRKHDARFPASAIRFCLEHARIAPDAIDAIAFYEKPFVKFERLIETYLAFAPRGYRSFAMAMPLWVREKLFQKAMIAKELGRLGFTRAAERLLFAEHHQSHAASALFGVHLLHWLQGELRRVQGDGPRAVWRAEVCAGDQGSRA
jgi:carbamoyltransferase